STLTCTPQAVDVLRKVNDLIAPTKAAGTEGVHPSRISQGCRNMESNAELR
ncbi:hypothetical protein MKW98_022127, partial [Papaver atlanticum]